MGTKANPGAFDCHAKAEPDEPMFTLLARDALAPGLVRIWASLKAGHFAVAEQFFNDLAQEAIGLPVERPHKTYEALQCSDDMILWRRHRFGALTADGLVARSAAPETPKSESTDTPNAADAGESSSVVATSDGVTPDQARGAVLR